MTNYEHYDNLANECYKKMSGETDPVRLDSLTKQFRNYVNMSNSLKSPATHQQQNMVSSGYGVYNSVSSNPYQAGYCGSPPTIRGGCCATAVW
jgi:hypothetical protein